MRFFRSVIVSMALSAIGGCLFLWLVVPVYRASGSLKLEDSQSELGALPGLSGSKNLATRISTESEVIRSRSAIRRSLQFIDWKVSFYEGDDTPKNELYPGTPFNVKILQQDKAFFPGVIHIRFIKETVLLQYALKGKNSKALVKRGKPIRLPGIAFILNGKPGTKINTDYTIRFNNIEQVTARISAGLFVDEPAKFSSLLTISMTDHNPAFATDAVNALIRQYIEDDRKQRISFCLGIIRSTDLQLNKLYQDTKRSAEKILNYRQEHLLNDPSPARPVAGPQGALELLNHNYAMNLRIVDLLLEKKLTAIIAMEASMPGAVLVDPAVQPGEALYPRRGAVLRSVILVGLVIGIGSGVFLSNFLSLPLISRCLKQYR